MRYYNADGQRYNPHLPLSPFGREEYWQLVRSLVCDRCPSTKEGHVDIRIERERVYRAFEQHVPMELLVDNLVKEAMDRPRVR